MTAEVPVQAGGWVPAINGASLPCPELVSARNVDYMLVAPPEAKQ